MRRIVLEDEAESLEHQLQGKTVARVYREGIDRVRIEFSDGTSLLAHAREGYLVLSASSQSS